MNLGSCRAASLKIQSSILAAPGGWVGAKSVGSTIEETALAVDALAEILLHPVEGTDENKAVKDAVSRGTHWLIKQTRQGISLRVSPIGLYFARLWYFEELYPVIFTLSTLYKVQRLSNSN